MEYHGEFRPWKRQITRWRKAGLSWTSVGRLLLALGCWTKVTGNEAEEALAIEYAARHAYRKMMSERRKRRQKWF
jgi:hypothetical protein